MICLDGDIGRFIALGSEHRKDHQIPLVWIAIQLDDYTFTNVGIITINRWYKPSNMGGF